MRFVLVYLLERCSFTFVGFVQSRTEIVFKSYRSEVVRVLLPNIRGMFHDGIVNMPIVLTLLLRGFAE